MSVPIHRTVEGVKQDWNNLIELGELSLGEPCYLHTLINCVVKDEELTQTIIIFLPYKVYGRKIALLDLRRNCLKGIKNYTVSTKFPLTKSKLLNIYAMRKIQLPVSLTEENLQTILKKYERARTIALWHDHSTILGRGYVLLTG